VGLILNSDWEAGLPDGFFFEPKIPIWVNFGGPYIDCKMLTHFMAVWNILQTFGIFYDRLVHFVFIWYIFPVLVPCTAKNLATLLVRNISHFVIGGFVAKLNDKLILHT
jgi:hypothetical protein